MQKPALKYISNKVCLNSKQQCFAFLLCTPNIANYFFIIPAEEAALGCSNYEIQHPVER